MCDCAEHACGALSRYVPMSAMTAEGQTRPERGTSGHSVSTVARRELTKRPPWGGGVRAESVSAETHTEFAHRLPDAVNKAGTGRALRVMRIARTAQKNLHNPNGRVNTQNQIVRTTPCCA